VVQSEIFPNTDKDSYYTLVFPVRIPAMGFATYFISPLTDFGHPSSSVVKPISSNAEPVLENEYLQVSFSPKTGRLVSILNKELDHLTMVSQDYLWWNASNGHNNVSHQASGAYIFRPNGTNPFPFNNESISISVFQGKLLQEVRQSWNDYVSQVVRLYQGSRHLEFESTIGPIDISDHRGKEVIIRFISDIQSNGTFYTDSQGQDMLRRDLNKRSWSKNFTIPEPIAGNYYPMNAASYIKDTKVQLTYVSDRSRGVSSLHNGQLETMLHRRLLVDDGRGVGEPLNESDVVRTVGLLNVDTPRNSSRHQRTLSLLLNNPLLFAFANTDDIARWKENYGGRFSPAKELPSNVHLLNFKTLDNGEVLLRLHHLYAVDEDPILSQPAVVDLDLLFPDLQIIKITEMTLSANQAKSDLHRLQWKYASDRLQRNSLVSGEDHSHPNNRQELSAAAHQIQLNPMQIRSFIVRYQSRS